MAAQRSRASLARLGDEVRLNAKLGVGSLMPKFIAYAVDLSGTALARYDLVATEAEAAKREARKYLEDYLAIEIWSDDHRRVARLKSQD